MTTGYPGIYTSIQFVWNQFLPSHLTSHFAMHYSLSFSITEAGLPYGRNEPFTVLSQVYCYNDYRIHRVYTKIQWVRNKFLPFCSTKTFDAHYFHRHSFLKYNTQVKSIIEPVLFYGINKLFTVLHQVYRYNNNSRIYQVDIPGSNECEINSCYLILPLILLHTIFTEIHNYSTAPWIKVSLKLCSSMEDTSRSES
jgi:hypothetical protein